MFNFLRKNNKPYKERVVSMIHATDTDDAGWRLYTRAVLVRGSPIGVKSEDFKNFSDDIVRLLEADDRRNALQIVELIPDRGGYTGLVIAIRVIATFTGYWYILGALWSFATDIVGRMP